MDEHLKIWICIILLGIAILILYSIKKDRYE